MALVPTVTGPSVASGITQAVDVPQTNALFGEKARTAKAVYDLGTTVKQGFNELGVAMERQQAEDDSNEAKKLDMEMADYMRTVEHGDGTEANIGYRNLRGEDAVNAYKGVSDGVSKKSEELRKRATNKNVRDMFDEQTGQRAKNFGAGLTDHMVVQRQDMLNATSIARIDTATNDAAAGYNNDQTISDSVTAGFSELMALGDRLGWSKEVYASKSREMVTQVIGGATEAAMAAGSTGRASALLKEFGGGMEADKVASYKTRIKNINEANAAKANAALRDQFEDDMKIWGAGFEPEGWNERKAAYANNPKMAEFIKVAEDNRAFAQEFSLMSLPDQQKAIGVASSAETMDKNGLYRLNLMVKQNEAFVKAVDAGDGLALAQQLEIIPKDVPPMDPMNPDSIRDWVQHARVASEKMGVNIAPFTKDTVNVVSQTLKDGTPDQKLAMIGSLVGGVGYQDGMQLVGALTKGETPGFGVAYWRAADKTPEGVKTSTDMLQGYNIMEATKKAGGTLEIPRDKVRENVQAALGDVLKNMDPADINAMVDGTTALWVQRTATGGQISWDDDTSPAAVQAAATEAVGGLATFNGRSTLLPKAGMDPYEFETGIKSMDTSQLRLRGGTGGVPQDASGRVFSPGQWSSYYLVSEGPARYSMWSKVDDRPLVDSNTKGRFVFDVTPVDQSQGYYTTTTPPKPQPARLGRGAQTY